MSDYPEKYYLETVDCVEWCLRFGQGHGAVSRTPPGGEETGFLCEVAAEGKLFFLRVCADRKLGFLLCDLYPTVRFDERHANSMQRWCVEKSAEWRTGTLQMDFARGTVFAHGETSFRDGAVSAGTLFCMEQLLLSMLLTHYEQLLAWTV